MSADHGTAEGLLDRLLDRTVVAGYTSVGYRLRRRAWTGADPRPGALLGKRALVTGASSGLGEATALGLAALGAHVHVLGRSPERTEPALDRIRARIKEHGWAGSAEAEACDVSDLDDVRRFATEFSGRLTGRGGALDVVVHNAGVLPPRRTVSAQGHELTLATHVLGPVLMTELLLPALSSATDPARVVLVTSGGMYAQALPVTDPEFSRGRYRGTTAYARSKRIQVELTPVLARRWQSQRVTVAAMHPGWADTPGVSSSLPAFWALTRPLLRTPREGADTIVWLSATEPGPPNGALWHDRVRRPTSYRSSTRPSPEDVDRVWAWVRDAVALDA